MYRYIIDIHVYNTSNIMDIIPQGYDPMRRMNYMRKLQIHSDNIVSLLHGKCPTCIFPTQLADFKAIKSEHSCDPTAF